MSYDITNLENISVITITKIDDSEEKLLKTLMSFSESVPKSQYLEYIVVWTGKKNYHINIPDHIKEKIKDLKLIYSEHANWSVQRNIGLKSAKGELILFIDDGMRFENGWFDELISTYRSHKNASAICGIVLPDASRTIWGRGQGILNHPGGGYRLLKENIQEIDFIHTGICLIRKDILLNVMFDETLKYGCEDMDVSIRIKKKFHDVRFLLNPNAISFHHTRDSISDISKWMFRYGKGRMDIYMRHRIRMSGFFIPKLILLLLLFLVGSALVNPLLSFLISFCAFYALYLLKLSKYKRYTDIKTFLSLPVTFWIMNTAFDIGRILRFIEILGNLAYSRLKQVIPRA